MDVDLDSMKYAELQKLAKKLGLKANLKADKLLKVIKQFYQKDKSDDEEKVHNENAAVVQEEGGSSGESSIHQDPENTVPCTTVFVNTRRGRGPANKRKISDAELTSSDPEVVKAPADRQSTHRTKKRKVAAVEVSSENKLEVPEETHLTDSGQQQRVDVKDDVKEDTGKATNVPKAGKIPRLQQKRTQMLKPVTPNFKKLHEAHFNKMESIDSYVQRKNKQMETYRTKQKLLPDDTKLPQLKSKIQLKPNPSRVSMLSPAPVNKRQKEEDCKAPANKSAGRENVSFKPSVLSTRRMNVRFSEATHDNEYKRSLVKTPARMSPCVASSTPQKHSTAAALNPNSTRMSTVNSVTKTPGLFVFTGNTSTSATPGTQKKPTFDLKASLSRPLSYKPHTGKLKPLAEAKDNAATGVNKSLTMNSHQKNYKQHQVQTREDRREKQTTDRKQKKQNTLGARRGLVMM